MFFRLLKGRLGKIIIVNQKTRKWETKALESLGNELQKSLPRMAGFSRANLFKMRAFYLAYEKVSQTVRQFEDLPIPRIPWGHNILLITKIKNDKECLWYAQMAIEEGWSHKALENAIGSKILP